MLTKLNMIASGIIAIAIWTPQLSASPAQDVANYKSALAECDRAPVFAVSSKCEAVIGLTQVVIANDQAKPDQKLKARGDQISTMVKAGRKHYESGNRARACLYFNRSADYARLLIREAKAADAARPPADYKTSALAIAQPQTGAAFTLEKFCKP